MLQCDLCHTKCTEFKLYHISLGVDIYTNLGAQPPLAAVRLLIKTQIFGKKIKRAAARAILGIFLNYLEGHHARSHSD
jgi:hypothetical protein